MFAELLEPTFRQTKCGHQLFLRCGHRKAKLTFRFRRARRHARRLQPVVRWRPRAKSLIKRSVSIDRTYALGAKNQVPKILDTTFDGICPARVFGACREGFKEAIWHRPGIPDTFDRWDDDIGGVRCKGSDTALCSSVRR
jgi:hypothetical protein